MMLTEIINHALCGTFAPSHMKWSYKHIYFFLLVTYNVTEQCNSEQCNF